MQQVGVSIQLFAHVCAFGVFCVTQATTASHFLVQGQQVPHSFIIKQQGGGLKRLTFKRLKMDV